MRAELLATAIRSTLGSCQASVGSWSAESSATTASSAGEIYDFGYHTVGSTYIVMGYLQGESLSLRLKRLGALPEARAVALCRQVAGALSAAHLKGIVHRDLKPDNIYIVRDPTSRMGSAPRSSTSASRS